MAWVVSVRVSGYGFIRGIVWGGIGTVGMDGMAGEGGMAAPLPVDRPSRGGPTLPPPGTADASPGSSLSSCARVTSRVTSRVTFRGGFLAPGFFWCSGVFQPGVGFSI